MKKYNSVLLVDDDDVSIYIAKYAIKKTGMANQTHVRKNGKEALDFLISNCIEPNVPECPDVILLDIKMPVMDGFEFLKEFRKNEFGEKKGGIKIIILTSSENPNDHALAVDYGVDGYVNKPLSPEKLQKALDNGWISSSVV